MTDYTYENIYITFENFNYFWTGDNSYAYSNLLQF